MNKNIIVLAFLCSALMAETVPNEQTFYGEDLSELNGKRIAGDEVATVHHFKLSESGWNISYRADGIGSLLGISNWTRLTYTGRVGEIKGNNGKPKTLDKGQEMRRPDGRSYYLINPPNPEYEEWDFKYKEFVSSDDKIQLRVFSDGDVILRIKKDDLFISQFLKTYEGSGFMLGVYEHNK